MLSNVFLNSLYCGIANASARSKTLLKFWWKDTVVGKSETLETHSFSLYIVVCLLSVCMCAREVGAVQGAGQGSGRSLGISHSWHNGMLLVSVCVCGCVCGCVLIYGQAWQTAKFARLLTRGVWSTAGKLKFSEVIHVSLTPGWFFFFSEAVRMNKQVQKTEFWIAIQSFRFLFLDPNVPHGWIRSCSSCC